MEENAVGMKFREFFRTSRNFLLFPLILVGVVVGFMVACGLMGAASFRHPWTWILPIIGLAIFSAIIWIFYSDTSMENEENVHGHKVFDGVDLGLHLPLNPERVSMNRMARDCYGYGHWMRLIGLSASDRVEARMKQLKTEQRSGANSIRMVCAIAAHFICIG